MKRLRINALCVLLSFLLTAAAWANGAELQAITGSGPCGENIAWNLDAAGNLTVTGTGDFYGEDNENYLPWRQFARYIVSVTVSDGVSRVPDDAFYGCDYLETVALGKDVKSVGREAFQNCVRLTDISGADALETVGEASFAACPALTDFTFAQHLKTIGAAAFAHCGFVNLTIPDSVTEIGEEAFHDCENLKSVVIGSGLTYLDRGVFANCQSLKTFAIPATLTAIDESAFSVCELDDVYYSGSAAQWNKIRGGGADDLAGRSWNIHFESTGPENAKPISYQIAVSDKGENYAEMTVNADENGMERVFAVQLYYDETGKYADSGWNIETFPTNDNAFSFQRWRDDGETPAKTAKLIILDREFRPVALSDTVTFE